MTSLIMMIRIATFLKKDEVSTSMLGIDIAPLTPDLRKKLRLDSKKSGLVIVDVKNGSEAAKRGGTTRRPYY